MGFQSTPPPQEQLFTLGLQRLRTGFRHAQSRKQCLPGEAASTGSPMDGILAYANVSKGYKAGSFGNFGGAFDSQYTPTSQESGRDL